MLRRTALVTLFAWSFAAHAQLPQPVTSLLATSGIPEDAVGALVIRGNTILVSKQAGRPMAPASTMKLVTTLVGLEELGPVFKGRTELLSNGEIAGGHLKGDLVLRGGADADLDGDVLRRMLQALRNQGIRRIDGRLVIDRSLFNPSRPDVGVPPFDESPEAYYNVIPDALLVNKNMLQIDMRSTARGIKLAMEPALDRVSIESAMTLIDGDCAKWEDGWKLPEVKKEADGRIRVVLNGTYPKDCARTNSINVLDRQDYVERLFRITWKQLGGALKGPAVEGTAPPDAKVLAAHASRALPEVVRDINKPSDNALARTLFLSLGTLEPDAVEGSRPIPGVLTQTTFIRSDLAVRNWMRRQGIDDAGLVMENGSGLSRLERITPQQMAGLLQAGLRSKWAPEFQASMPIVAVDGTMRKRLPDSPAATRARMKTGTLRDVVALAGYVPDATGQMCVVVAMINSDEVKDGKGRAVLDALVDWVARSGRADGA
ncbi:MAG TPA: D-alanyl-D-alanine carboxypeptidase/D-alanyl-D-alanine-endopeptidase [Telluria sp.]